MAFIDLAKAFDTINQDLLCTQLTRLGVLHRFLTILKQLQVGMKAHVVMDGLKLDPFSVEAGLRPCSNHL